MKTPNGGLVEGVKKNAQGGLPENVKKKGSSSKSCKTQ